MQRRWFRAFADKVLDAAVAGKITDVEVLKAQFEEERVALVAKIGENINIRRVAALEGDVLGSYQHGARIGVLVAAKGADEELVKHIAMHVAASKPEFIKPEDVSAEVVEKNTVYSWISRCSLVSRKKSQRKWLKAA